VSQVVEWPRSSWKSFLFFLTTGSSFC